MACRAASSRIILSVVVALSAVATTLAAGVGTADAATTFKSFELTGGGKLPAIQVPGSSIRSFSLGVTHNPGGAGWGGGNYAPSSAAELTLTARLDLNTSAMLAKAMGEGTHFKSGSFLWEGNGKGIAYCMTDVMPTTLQRDIKDPLLVNLGFAYTKLAVKYGTGEPSCSGTGAPPVESTLLGIRGKSLLARVDCLSARCSGILAVNFPAAACRPSQEGSSASSLGGAGGRGNLGQGGGRCSFTGGVRVGLNLNKLGKVKFSGNHVEFTGGLKIQSSGGDKFSMLDGSVRVLKLRLPPPLEKWGTSHKHATLGTIIVVRGSRRAIIQHDALNPSAKLPSGAPTGAEAAPGEEAPLQPQALSFTECSTPVVGTPTIVTVKGMINPPRGNVGVTLTYKATNGPQPFPADVVDNVTTNAAGVFEEPFDRQREGKDYSWNVVASVAAGGGFAAAQSPACAVPIP